MSDDYRTIPDDPAEMKNPDWMKRPLTPRELARKMWAERSRPVDDPPAAVSPPGGST